MYTLKKSLGQHFLKDEAVCQKIVEALRESPMERLVEIGPGGGALTRRLLQLPGIDFRCIEIDEEKVHFLLKTFPALKDKIIHADILQCPKPFADRFAVIGNFPYNISTEIVFKMLEWRESVTHVVGMFQKEVAMRLAAREGSRIYGVTSVLVQAFFKVDYLFEVDEQAFNPPPKVKSAVIRFTPLANPIEMKDARSLSILVKAAFGQRRKTLRNAVKPYFSKEILTEELFNRRAEQLSVQEFGRLTFRMH